MFLRYDLALSFRLEYSGATSQVVGITGDHHHVFVFLVETGFYHVGQAALELLTSCHPWWEWEALPCSVCVLVATY